jgi:uncharacterized protein
MLNDYYVYVYIDPRNHEEFYYGKGKGTRKNSHLNDSSDSKKTKRINEIKSEGSNPIIRVIASNLSESEALLIEKTLLWKLGKWTTNIATGHYKDKFRPHNTLHKELPGFDYRNAFYYYNVGEGNHRNWDDYIKFNFISAGQDKRYRDAMLGFNEGDIFAAYLKGQGFVGVGRIKERAKRIKEVTVNGKLLLDLPLKCRNMSNNFDDKDKSEYVCLVEWLKYVPRESAKFRSKPKLYTTTHVRASLNGQPDTIKFIENEFNIVVKEVIA